MTEIIDSVKAAVLLEIENQNHTPDRCFAELPRHSTLSIRLDDRVEAAPREIAAHISSALREHVAKSAESGVQIVAVATHRWEKWRDNIDGDVQDPFRALAEQSGLRYVELPTEGCNAHFRRFVSDQIEPLNAAT